MDAMGAVRRPVKMQLQALPLKRSLDVLCVKALPSELAKGDDERSGWGDRPRVIVYCIGRMRLNCSALPTLRYLRVRWISTIVSFCFFYLTFWEPCTA